MSQYHEFSSEISLYPQQVSQELMAAFVVGRQYMQDVSDNCRLAIIPEDISISRHSLIATLYYYIAQQSMIQRIIVISSDPRISSVTLPSSSFVGIKYILGKKMIYDTDLIKRVSLLDNISLQYEDIALQSASWYTHVNYAAMLPQKCTILPIICPLGDMFYLESLVDCCMDDPHTMVILMDTFAFRPSMDDTNQQDMQTLIYEPGGNILRFFNHYVATHSWLFYALRVDKSPITSDIDRYTSILMAG